ncbi:RHS repeat-associated core domain-containing protein [Calothrix sp. 336/3]|uniref:RHS repeat-associated core domain-containing protein n=1 Tax=Calothrix sp. 336/3 TaxID=1337936 RepID=UPI00143CBD96
MNTRVMKLAGTNTAFTTTYGYDTADNLVSVTSPGGQTVSYTRNTLEQITGVTTKAANATAAVNVATNVSWLPYDGLKGLTFGNGVVHSNTYDTDYRLTRISAVKSSIVVQNLTLTWNGVDNITAINDNAVAARNQSFVYDKEDRLTQATQSGVGGYGVLYYTYDLNGNRLTSQQTGSTISNNKTYSYDTGNRLTGMNDNGVSRTLGYIASGSITSDSKGSGTADDVVYTYNNAGRIVAVSKGGTVLSRYVYNAKGERVQKLTASNALGERFHYDMDGKLLAITNAAGGVVASYIYLGDTLIAEVGGNGVLSYVHSDHLGTPQKITNAAGVVVGDYRWQPFGESLAANNNYRIKFPGQSFDAESGLHYNYQRTYDPGLGRYLEDDPIGLQGGLNRYGYVAGNPVKYIDTEGLQVALPLPLPRILPLPRFAPTELPWISPMAPALPNENTESQARQSEYERAKRYCDSPPQGSDCSALSRKIDHANTCISMYEEWDSKWNPGRHRTKIDEWKRRRDNLKKEHNEKCTQTCI